MAYIFPRLQQNSWRVADRNIKKESIGHASNRRKQSKLLESTQEYAQEK